MPFFQCSAEQGINSLEASPGEGFKNFTSNKAKVKKTPDNFVIVCNLVRAICGSERPLQLKYK